MFRKIVTLPCWILVMSLFVVPSMCFAADTGSSENFNQNLARVKELKEQGKYTQAITELSWVSNQLQKLHIEQLKKYFPADVEGMTAGQFKSGNALGLVTLERMYTNKSGSQMKVILTGSSATKGAASGMGALANFAQMAAMMDQGTDSEVVRIHGTRANIKQKGKRMELSMPLSGGMLFKIEQSGGTASKDQIVSIANAFDVKGANSYLGAAAN